MASERAEQIAEILEEQGFVKGDAITDEDYLKLIDEFLVVPEIGPDRCCPECKGSGVLDRSDPILSSSGLRQPEVHVFTITCSKCGGRGYLETWQMEKEEAGK